LDNDPVPLGPALSSARASLTYLTLIFEEALDGSSTPPAGAVSGSGTSADETMPSEVNVTAVTVRHSEGGT